MMRSTLAQRASNFSTSVKAINTKTTKASKLVKSTAPFESQGMSAAAKHRAQRLSYIQESSKVKAAAVVNGGALHVHTLEIYYHVYRVLSNQGFAG